MSKIKRPTFSLAEDYATMSCESGTFYYGYESTADDGEWCFTASVNGINNNIKIPFSLLKAKDQFACGECLMVGIGWVLTKYRISIR